VVLQLVLLLLVCAALSAGGSNKHSMRQPEWSRPLQNTRQPDSAAVSEPPCEPGLQADTGHAARRGHTTVLKAGDVAPIWHDLTSTGARASTQNGS
jgi:hypothetical protein